MSIEKPETELEDLYRQYIKGKLTRKDLEGGIYKYLLNRLGKYRLFKRNREKWNDFLSWLYPRISRAIDNYRNLGSSLDAYINTVVRGASKEYVRHEARRYLTEYACWQARAEEIELHESEIEYGKNKNCNTAQIKIKPRQILILLLKSYFFANDDLVERVAKINRMKSAEIRKLIDELRCKRSCHDADITDLCKRLQCQYYRCLAYQKQMKSTIAGTEFYAIIKARFERAKKRFHSMKKRLEGMRKGASNRMIAEVLKIPKGTVDSGLYKIKRLLAPYLKKIES